jgi:hypothetical protein
MYRHLTVQGQFQGQSDDLQGWKYGCVFGKVVARNVDLCIFIVMSMYGYPD